MTSPESTLDWPPAARWDRLNLILTNGLPRRWLTRWVGRLAQIETPWIRDLCIAIWRACSDLDLSEAKQTRFRSMRECFIRELKDGARPIDPQPGRLVSPCDAIVGAGGTIVGDQLLQAKAMPYRLSELLGDANLARALHGGQYLTLRLQSSMYHRFHAPAAGTIRRLRFFPGDVWNVNPPTLRFVHRVFCRNERAVLQLDRADGGWLLLVPVAAIAVASLRIHGLDAAFGIDYRGPLRFELQRPVQRGDELGWFEQGSTILLMLPPGAHRLPGLEPGRRVRMGEALFACD